MEEVFIGRVVHSETGWSRLEPLAAVVEGRWRLLDDVEKAFPPSGRVFALPRALPTPRHGSLWLFTRQLNNRPEPGRDMYVVDVASPPTLIVDLSHVSVEEARQTLFDLGIRQPRQGSREAVVLLVEGAFCVLELEPATRGVWKAVPSSHPVNLMTAAEEWKESDAVDGQKYLPSMHIPSNPVLRRVNWSSDAEFISKILLRTRKYAQQLGDTKYAGPTREGIQYIARALEQVQLFPGSAEDIELDLERLQAQWPVLQAKLAAAEEMHSMLIESSTAKEQLAKAVADAKVEETARLRAELEVEVRAALLADLEEKVRERESLTQELAALATQRVAAIEENQRLQREMTTGGAQLKQLHDDVQAFIHKLLDSFERLPVGEAAVARTLAEQLSRSLTKGEGHMSGFVPSVVAPWSLPAMENGEEGSPEVASEDLEPRLDTAGRAHAIESDSLVAMHAFARAGELVLLTGVNAGRAFAAYTECVSGRLAYSMAVDPSTIGLDDLWRAPGSLAPTPLAYAWNRAMSDASRPVVVCISNLDASPFHLWIRSFAERLRGRARPHNLLVFATTAASTSDAAEPYPFQADLLRWLVPIEPGPSNGSSLQVLSSISGPSVPTWLRWCSPQVDAVIKTEAFAVRIAEVPADAETVLRAAHVAAALLKSTSDTFFWKWVKLLIHGSAEELPVFLRQGYASLAKLGHQR